MWVIACVRASLCECGTQSGYELCWKKAQTQAHTTVVPASTSSRGRCLSRSPSLSLSSAGHTCCSNFVVAAVVMVIVGQVHNLTFSQPLELRCWVRLHSFVLYAAVAVEVVVIVVVAVDRMPPSVRSGKRH